MFTIELTQKEQDVLREMLLACITEIHAMIDETRESEDYQAELRQRKDILVKMLNQLEHAYVFAD